MAKELNRLVRQQLTARLDGYALQSRGIFRQVISVIDNSVVPILRRCGMAGEAIFLTEEAIFTDNPKAIDMLIDVLSDRGFHVSYMPEVKEVPVRIDMDTGNVILMKATSHRYGHKRLHRSQAVPSLDYIHMRTCVHASVHCAEYPGSLVYGVSDVIHCQICVADMLKETIQDAVELAQNMCSLQIWSRCCTRSWSFFV